MCCFMRPHKIQVDYFETSTERKYESQFCKLKHFLPAGNKINFVTNIYRFGKFAQNVHRHQNSITCATHTLNGWNCWQFALKNLRLNNWKNNHQWRMERNWMKPTKGSACISSQKPTQFQANTLINEIKTRFAENGEWICICRVWANHRWFSKWNCAHTISVRWCFAHVHGNGCDYTNGGTDPKHKLENMKIMNYEKIGFPGTCYWEIRVFK